MCVFLNSPCDSNVQPKFKTIVLDSRLLEYISKSVSPTYKLRAYNQLLVTTVIALLFLHKKKRLCGGCSTVETIPYRDRKKVTARKRKLKETTFNILRQVREDMASMKQEEKWRNM